MRVLFLGDRSMPLSIAVPVVAVQLLKLINDNIATTIVYGTAVGVEHAVGLVLAAADVTLFEKFEYLTAEDGRPDFLQAYRSLDGIDKVVLVHGDLHSSRVFRAAQEVFGDEKIEVVSPDLVFV